MGRWALETKDTENLHDRSALLIKDTPRRSSEADIFGFSFHQFLRTQKKIFFFFPFQKIFYELFWKLFWKNFQLPKYFPE